MTGGLQAGAGLVKAVAGSREPDETPLSYSQPSGCYWLAKDRGLRHCQPEERDGGSGQLVANKYFVKKKSGAASSFPQSLLLSNAALSWFKLNYK